MRGGLTLRLAATVLALACIPNPGWADSIAYTTNPDASGFAVVTGTNSSGGSASWKAGGHCTYQKTAMPYPYPSGYYSYAFTVHNTSVCNTEHCSEGLHSTYIKVTAISGAGTSSSDPNVTVWINQRAYKGGVLWAGQWPDDSPMSYSLDTNGDWYMSRWGGPDGTVTNETIQFKVGAWQGDPSPWQATAATPGL